MPQIVNYMKSYLKINSVKSILSVLILLISYSTDNKAYSDFVHLDCLSLDDGLSHNLVHCITQDRFGFMWFGTQYGLNKFDGYKFTTFLNNPGNYSSISSNLILATFVDQNQNLWIGTSSGLNLYNYDLENFKVFDIPNQTPNNNAGNEITAIFQCQSSNLFVGTKSNGLYIFDIKEKSFHPINIQGIENNFITAICNGDNEYIWLGTSKGLIHYNLENGNSNKYVQDLKNPKGIHGLNIHSLYLDKSKLWIGHENGIDCLEIETENLDNINTSTINFKHFKLPAIETSENEQKTVSTIYKDEDGTLWIGTHGSGIYFFSKKTSQFKHYRPCKCLKDTGGLSSTWINKIFQNKNGTIWVGTNEGLGRFTFNKKLFKKYEYDKNNKNSLCQGEVKALAQDENGNIWIGTWGNGICQLDLKTGNFSHIITNKYNKNGLVSNFISEIYKDSSGNIWIGSDNPIGLYKHDPNLNSIIHHPWNFENTQDFIPHPISSIIDQNNSIYWIGTSGGGLIRYDSHQNKFSVFKNNKNNPSSLCNDHIYTIIQDNPNTLLITTANGLCRFEIDTGIFQTIPIKPEEHLKSKTIAFSILKIKNNFYWLGTNKGLYKVESNNKNYSISPVITEKDGLRGNAIYGILQNNQDQLWLLTNKGLSVYYSNSNQIRNFTTEDGCVKFTKKLTHGSNAQLKTDTGYMFFGGVNGLTYYELEDIKSENIFIPPVLITDFLVNNKSITPSNSSILKQSISRTTELSLPSDFGNFSINFSILDYTSPSQNQYAYMLKGWDQEWIYSGTQHSAHYAAIPPGNYIFVAKGANHEGLWNNEGVELEINIYPLFWETWWFRSLGVLLVISLFLIVHFYQLLKVKKEKIIQENVTRKVIDSQELERKRIASELHDSLGQNLQVINSEITQLKVSPKEGNEKDLNQLSNLVKDSIKEVREIAYDLHPHQLEQLGLQKAIESAIKKIAYISDIDFNISISKIDKYFNEQTSIHFFRIVQEAVYNIYKHAETKNASVEIFRRKNQINVNITDDGIGFEKTRLFKDGEPIQKGLGFSNMHERAKLINGQLNIYSEINKGTTVKIKILINL